MTSLPAWTRSTPHDGPGNDVSPLYPELGQRVRSPGEQTQGASLRQEVEGA